MTDDERVRDILHRVKSLAADYYALTGKPLGVTGEIGEYEAARLLKMRLAEAREPGFDLYAASGEKVQVKTRRLDRDLKNFPSQRVGGIKLDQPWDCVVLVLLNSRFEAYEIWRAERPEIESALLEPGSKARNERGSLSISKFRQLGRCVWDEGRTA